MHNVQKDVIMNSMDCGDLKLQHFASMLEYYFQFCIQPRWTPGFLVLGKGHGLGNHKHRNAVW